MRTRSLSPLLLSLYVLSGFSALALETLWTRLVSLRAGNTVVAATLVIAVFFASAALGNLWGARLVARTRRPLRYYGRCETASGLAALLTFAFFRHAEQSSIIATLLLVGPPVFLAGIAFPSLAEAFVPGPAERTARGAPFYGGNLLGAAIGVIAGGVILPWWLGVQASFAIAAGVQIAGGLAAWWFAGSVESPAREPMSECAHRFGWLVLAASGLLSLAAQSLLIMWVRQILEGSIYAVAAVLATFVGGFGLGSLAVSALRAQGISTPKLLALFAGLGAAALFFVPGVATAMVRQQIDLSADTPIGMLMQALGKNVPWLLSLAACLGGVFPLAWDLARSRSTHQGRVLGFMLATNKLGAALGVVLGTFLLPPACGLPIATVIVGWGYLLVAMALSPRRLSFALLPIALIGVWQAARSRETLGLTPELRPIADYTGAYGPVVIVEDRNTGSRQILLNSRQRLSGTQRALSSQRHQSWVPLLFCRHPERVMTIGMASGISAAAALDFPVRELHAVELVPEVVQAAREHFGEWNRRLFTDPCVHLHVGDGRVILAQSPEKFDAIICDLFFPTEDSSANLYSREFFERGRERLNPGGVFCLWLPCYQHTAQTAGSIVRTFADAFPRAGVVRSNLDPIQPVVGLLGSNEPLPISRDFISAQLRAIGPRSAFFESPENAWLLLAGDLHAADPDFAAFPLTTDDRPLLAYLGPRQPPPRERLVGMTFLDWIGRRFVRPLYPSCDLGDTAPEDLLASVRAANLYFAAAVADSRIPGDSRSEDTRLRQTRSYLQRAQALQPAAHLPIEALGQ